MAQIPGIEATSTPAARLEALENTYTVNLRRIHAPVLQDYLRQLELQKSLFAARGRTEEIQQTDAEIARVKQAMSTTGLFQFAPPKPAPPPAAATIAGGDVPRRGNVLSLPAAKAVGATTTDAAPLGQLEWTVEKLASGTYDVLMVYSCPNLDKPVDLVVNFASQALNHALPVERATGSEKDFRVCRLGTITVSRDVARENLRLQATAASPRLAVRSVIFAVPKPPKA